MYSFSLYHCNNSSPFSKVPPRIPSPKSYDYAKTFFSPLFLFASLDNPYRVYSRPQRRLNKHKVECTLLLIIHDSKNIEHDSCSVVTLPVEETIGIDLLTASQPPNSWTWVQRPLRNFPLTTDSTFEPLHKKSSSIHHDTAINDYEGEHAILSYDPDQRPREIEFPLGQTFSNRGHSVMILQDHTNNSSSALSHKS